jgi:hypothetical protein
MENKPNPNPFAPKKESGDQPPAGANNNVINIGGDVGMLANIGSGNVYTDQVAGRDLVVNGVLSDSATGFADLLIDLKNLILKAKEAGELGDTLAQQAVATLEEAAELVTKEKKPPKQQLVKKLEFVADLLDAATDLMGASGGISKILMQAAPIAAFLVKLASRLF